MLCNSCPDIVEPGAAYNGEQSLQVCTGPAQEHSASATWCEVNVSGRGRTASFGWRRRLRHLGCTRACPS